MVQITLPDTSGVRSTSLGKRLAAPCKAVIASLRRWWELRATIRTLRGLDSHALRDIGIERYDIERVARSHCWPNAE